MASVASGSRLGELIRAAEYGELPMEKWDESVGFPDGSLRASNPEAWESVVSRAFAPMASRFGDPMRAAAAAQRAVTEVIGSLMTESDLEFRQFVRFGAGARVLTSGDTLIVLDPDRRFNETQRVDPRTIYPGDLREHLWRAEGDRDAFALVSGLEPEMIGLVGPTVVHTSKPAMIPLCVASPLLEIEANGESSTAGVFCRDAAGVLGVTACFHGTGPTGTTVRVGLRDCVVGNFDKTQDIVFIPLPSGYNLPTLIGCNTATPAGQPWRGQAATFEGVTSGALATYVDSWDQGVLRKRPEMQLKVQTGPDLNRGDSGAALVDDQDRVMAFAFERTAWAERPEFADWIWAANALAALGLSPV